MTDLHLERARPHGAFDRMANRYRHPGHRESRVSGRLRRPVPSTTPRRALLTALRDICAQQTVPLTALEVRRHAAALFPELDLTLCLADAQTAPAGPRGHDIPLVARGRTIGVLRAAADPAEVLDAPAAELLTGLVDQAALALANAALLEERAELAQRDPLTGLLNHREFHESLRAATAAPAEGQQLAVVLLDLDHFKCINDGHGHAEGDRVLRAVAGALASSCRAGDPTFRIGGDEFAMLLHGADADEATRIALRARAAVTRLDGRVGLSFGVASWPADADGRDGLLARADERLYVAKRAGRSRGPMPAARRQHERLAVASRLSLELAPLTDPAAIAERAVDELHRSFDFYLAVIQRLDGEVLRVVGAAGPLASNPAFLAFEQHISEGVNGRVARTGAPALIADTRDDPDYLRRDPRTDPGSEVALPVVVDGRVWGVLNLEQVAPGALDADDLLLAEVVAAQVGAALHRVELTAEIEGTVATTLSALVDVLEAKDAYTAQHARDVVELSICAGRRLGMDARALRDVRYAALLHDIGKIAVPSDLLRKPARLTEAEFDQVKAHSEVGDRLLRGIPFLHSVAPLVRAIHERWDGRGYPDGLCGEDIPLGARVVGVCDALDAMVSDRPYRAALGTDAALAELERCSGTQFDPRVVAAVLAEVSARASGRRALAR